jgi:hypothetical protein
MQNRLAGAPEPLRGQIQRQVVRANGGHEPRPHLASRLKYGLRFVSHQLWDEVLGWAVTRGRWDDADLQAIDAYLFGGTVFRYATIFGARFSRSAFVKALAAGVRDEPFPLRAILLATR